MKKLFLLLTALCCFSLNTWAYDNYELIGSSIPSGTGVHARSIVNIQYDPDTQILSFEDIYEPEFTAYERQYDVYFYEYNKDYAFWSNGLGSYIPIFYGKYSDTDGLVDAFIPGNTQRENDNPFLHEWAEKSFSNCAAGTREIDLSSVVPQIRALGYNHVMVGISPRYRISSTADWVKYSIYGDWHYWLMNVAHFWLEPVRAIAEVPFIKTPTGTWNVSYCLPGSVTYRYESLEHVWMCEGQDTAKIEASIFPTETMSGGSKTCTVTWQKRKDGETAWSTLSLSQISKTEWNNAQATGNSLTVNNDFCFKSGDIDSTIYIRLAVPFKGDTIFTNPVQIDARYRVKVTGPVKYKTKDSNWYEVGRISSAPLKFDTLKCEVAAKDTIFFKSCKEDRYPNSKVVIGGKIISAPDGTACATDWTASCLVEPTINKVKVQFYVDGKLYTTLDNILCGFAPSECGYTTDDIKTPVLPGVIFQGWKDRATGMEYSASTPLYLMAGDDLIYDAVIDKYSVPDGALAQWFKIGTDKYVSFAIGNLQYQASTDTWRFAENQYEYIGDAAGNNTLENRDTQSHWIDLFGFGTSGYEGLMPYEMDYSKFVKTAIGGTEYDWGVHNAISNGGGKKGQWRLLTKDEWQYLLDNTKECIVNIEGLGYCGVIVPWSFETPEGVTTLADGANLTAEDYATYNSLGVPFFPLAGYSVKIGTTFLCGGMGSMGFYHTSEVQGDNNLVMNFYNSGENTYSHRIAATSNIQLYSVRLACDWEKKATLAGDVNGDDVVDIADVNAVLTVMFSEKGYSAEADVNEDGAVDIADVNAVLTVMFSTN